MAKWKCPKCGSHSLSVVGQVLLQLMQHKDDDEFETIPDENGSSHEWDEKSLMVCRTCDNHGLAGEFQYETEDRTT